MGDAQQIKAVPDHMVLDGIGVVHHKAPACRCPDGSGDGRLGHEELFRRFGDTAAFHRRAEVLQLVQIHGASCKPPVTYCHFSMLYKNCKCF